MLICELQGGAQGLAQHPQTAQGVTLQHGRVLVDFRVAIAHAVFEHAVDGLQHLAGSGQGVLDEDAAQVGVAAGDGPVKIGSCDTLNHGRIGLFRLLNCREPESFVVLGSICCCL